MLYHPDIDSQTILNQHTRWNRQHAEPLRGLIQGHVNDRAIERRLRIGYVSRDFRQHPVGRFLLPLIENHDRGLFEIFCYSDVAGPDEMTVRFQSLASCWREIAGLKHEQVAAQIRTDQIDILVDLAGHTTGSRLLVFAQKPAPVQVSYLGYPADTGLSAIDYRFIDPWADPDQAEKIWRLAKTNWCFAEQTDTPSVQPPPMAQQGCITFGSFNNFAKVTNSMLQIWAGILSRVPNSRLLLKAGAFVSATARDRARRGLVSHGIDITRLILLGPQPDHATHLATYSQIDIALDTFPYHGTTTTCDALWMGVPVITLAGQTHVSRVGVSLLSNIGLPELIANTTDEYMNTAVALANTPDRLKNLRTNLRQRMKQSPLMDCARICKRG